MKKIIAFFCSCILCFSCGGKKTPNIENINLSIHVERFDKDVFSENAAELQKKYGDFFNLYCEGIIGIGAPNEPDFDKNFQQFKNDSIVQLSNKFVGEAFSSDNFINDELTQAFKYVKYYFPDKATPKVYTFISGFNTSLMLTDSVVGIGLDKYLGCNMEIYNELSFSKYLTRNMRKERIAPDVVKTWAIGEFPFNDLQCTLLDKIIYEGKLLFLQKLTCPNIADTTLLGFTSDNLRFCKNNEKKMWTYLIENKLLYSNNYTIINKFTSEAPFTTDFSQESPGRAANWLGFNIVQKYVDETDSSLADLMNENDSKKILSKSTYNPKESN